MMESSRGELKPDGSRLNGGLKPIDSIDSPLPNRLPADEFLFG